MNFVDDTYVIWAVVIYFKWRGIVIDVVRHICAYRVGRDFYSEWWCEKKIEMI
ncbi:MAG: hypothetical protein Hyperionvirus31_12 [Hyperionvirus sp.]|uniref:Uncharacterized protein n=1 Tax=Hyperionvirus sp. TaxID=2487770 RepID=A0A3G5ABU8_9VIRU|nr:MAG: hypothetical protein Hyperionvirus31_12 [Hyperionvirus sp.]